MWNHPSYPFIRRLFITPCTTGARYSTPHLCIRFWGVWTLDLFRNSKAFARSVLEDEASLASPKFRPDIKAKNGLGGKIFVWLKKMGWIGIGWLLCNNSFHKGILGYPNHQLDHWLKFEAEEKTHIFNENLRVVCVLWPQYATLFPRK